MDPITFAIELELGGVLLALVGSIATWLNHKHQQKQRHQRERHHRERSAMQERHHRETMSTVNRAAGMVEERTV